jgi:hypothetical protein
MPCLNPSTRTLVCSIDPSHGTFAKLRAAYSKHPIIT